MSAKEMFEELGYEKEKYEVVYGFGYTNNFKVIEFVLLGHNFENKVINVYNWATNARESITMKELKAINKQIKELDWNE